MIYIKVFTATLFWYLIGVFYSTSFDISLWTEDTRLVIVIMFVCTVIIHWAIEEDAIGKPENPHA